MDWSRRVNAQKQRMLVIYIVSLALFALSILLMPFVNAGKRDSKIPMYLDGALFWVSGISTIYQAIRINHSRRINAVFNKEYPGLKKLALLHFFQNKPALVMDLMMFISLSAFAIGRFLAWNLKVQFFLISMFVFSFGMHCMLNGINYMYIKHKTTARRG